VSKLMAGASIHRPGRLLRSPRTSVAIANSPRQSATHGCFCLDGQTDPCPCRPCLAGGAGSSRSLCSARRPRQQPTRYDQRPGSPGRDAGDYIYYLFCLLSLYVLLLLSLLSCCVVFFGWSSYSWAPAQAGKRRAGTQRQPTARQGKGHGAGGERPGAVLPSRSICPGRACCGCRVKYSSYHLCYVLCGVHRCFSLVVVFFVCVSFSCVGSVASALSSSSSRCGFESVSLLYVMLLSLVRLQQVHEGLPFVALLMFLSIRLVMLFA